MARSAATELYRGIGEAIDDGELTTIEDWPDFSAYLLDVYYRDNERVNSLLSQFNYDGLMSRALRDSYQRVFRKVMRLLHPTGRIPLARALNSICITDLEDFHSLVWPGRSREWPSSPYSQSVTYSAKEFGNLSGSGIHRYPYQPRPPRRGATKRYKKPPVYVGPAVHLDVPPAKPEPDEDNWSRAEASWRECAERYATERSLTWEEALYETETPVLICSQVPVASAGEFGGDSSSGDTSEAELRVGPYNLDNVESIFVLSSSKLPGTRVARSSERTHFSLGRYMVVRVPHPDPWFAKEGDTVTHLLHPETDISDTTIIEAWTVDSVPDGFRWYVLYEAG